MKKKKGKKFTKNGYPICEDCDSLEFNKTGAKWSLKITCAKCEKERRPTLTEFYGNGVVD